MTTGLAKILFLTVFVLYFHPNTIQATDKNPDQRTNFTMSNAGNIRLAISDQGFLGNGFSMGSSHPSCSYPQGSNVEHLYFGGLWVGAVKSDGTIHVSTSAQDANGFAELQEILDFRRTPSEYPNYPDYFRIISNIPTSPDYAPDARAPFHVISTIDDYANPEAGNHHPLGIKIIINIMAWSLPSIDDFVILDYTIINISGQTLSDLYVGFFNDTTVGNTNVNNPYNPNAPVGWNYFDDLNSAWRPGDLAADPQIWMMEEHDGDGDAGMATSWIGCRLLETSTPAVPESGQPPVSYNAWSYRNVPGADDYYFEYDEPEVLLPGKYQLMSNGQFDVGVTQDGDFTTMGNRLALLSTGPFPTLAADDTLSVAFAIVSGVNEQHLLWNSLAAQTFFNNNYTSDPSAVDSTPAMPSRIDYCIPNPFNPTTKVTFTLKDGGPTRLSIHNLQGHLVATLINGDLSPGKHSVNWNGCNDSGARLGSGAYMVRLENDSRVDYRKISLIK